jgi:hypothetical protein
MDVSVILEKIEENGYRASAFVPAPMVAEAATRDEAVDRIRAMLSERLAGTEVIQVAVPATTKPNPWLAIAGTWRDRPDMDQVMENIQTYRREVDADPDRL